MAEIKTPVGNAPLIPVVMLASGLYLAWFGIHYWRQDVTWPTTPVKAVLTGGTPPAKTSTTPHISELTSDVSALQPDPQSVGAAGEGGTVAGTPTPVAQAGGGTPASNQALAKLLASSYGWHVDPYWSALVRLWNSESGWRNTVWNTSASCGNGAYAYGIVQACGHGNRKTIPGHGYVCPYPAGNPGNPPECGGTSNPAAQITWGLIYIKQRYGDPTKVPLGGY